MNVALAFQFFHIYEALIICENRHEDLEDCEGTIKFCERITKLIRAMNSRTAFSAMTTDNESWKIIEDFLKYLEEWKTVAKEKNYECLSDNCSYGLKISLKASLEICEFLITKCNFKYLMTARLNQDSLEVTFFPFYYAKNTAIAFDFSG
ncbi:uncharacterized protein LOC127282175 [Leptopilina boulardi]|uniref:uncharacterized protein LOC127282175 n=1 Tax=Leptopilina boulardi TaxID=63433 RepID=UPI0021F5A569|nr:uncharacterized protein LOC127282175 [Leptopilina boulardi]